MRDQRSPEFELERTSKRELLEMADGWELVSCRDKEPWHVIFMFIQMLVGNPNIVPAPSTATWTMRQIATGVIRNVTAHSTQEAKEKILDCIFDRD